MNNVVMWIGALLAAVLAALFTVPMFIDWNSYRGVFEEEATRILGRDVRVGGGVNLRLLPTPYLRFEKLRISDTGGGGGEPLFRAETFTLWLSVPPLLRGDLEVRHMALDQPVLNLSVDEQGVGNWSTLSVRKARLPFVPHNVAFQSVEIEKGIVTLRGSAAGEIAHVEAIDGELSAEALEGPFKFTGKAAWGGETREIRLATGRLDPNGELRFKGTARPLDNATGISAQLEGSILAVNEKPRLEGALAMSVPLPELPAAAEATAPPAAQGAPDQTRTAATVSGKPVSLDLKGRLEIDAARLAAREIIASIENVGQPQLLTGGAVLEWGEPGRLSFDVASHWLDLDRLAPKVSGRASPVETIATLTRGLAGAMPSRKSVTGSINVEQLSLGGEAVGGLDVALKRDSDGPLVIERFLAALPAGARIGIEGRIETAADGLDLDGRATLAGPSLERLAKWAAAGDKAGQMLPDGTFALDANIAVNRDALRLSDVRSRLANHHLTGSVTLPLSRAGPINVDVEADSIESAWLFNGAIDRDNIMRWLGGLTAYGRDGVGERPAGSSGTAADKSGPVSRDLEIKLRTGKLDGPDRSLRDVDLALKMRAGIFTVDRVSFRDGDNLTVDLTARIATASESGEGGIPGHVKGSIAAASNRAVRDLAEMLGIPDGERVRRLAGLAPLSLAGAAHLGRRAPGSLDIRIDGLAGGGRVDAAIGLDAMPGASAAQWLAAPAEVTLAASEAPVDDILALLTGGGTVSHQQGTAALRANLAVKAAGAPSSGMVVDGVVTGPGLNLAYNGKATFDESGVPSLGGTLEVAADRLGDVLAITGLSGRGNGLEQSLTGTVGLATSKDGTLALKPSGLTIAGARIDGALRVARAAEGRTHIDGEVTVDRATVGGLIGGLTAGAPRPMPATAQDASRDAGRGRGYEAVWTEQPFSAEAFERFEGSVKFAVDRLALADGLTLADARLALRFAAGRIDATLEEGHGLGGVFAGDLALDKAAAGARVSGKVAANGIELSEIARIAGAGPADGTAAATLSFSGQALSPAGLITSLEGSGITTLSKAEIAGMTPDAVRATAETAFAREFAINEAALTGVLKGALAKGRLGIGPRQVTMTIDDGALKLERFETRTPNGRVETLVTVDLASFAAETEWRVQAASKEGRANWPVINVFYSGPLAALPTTEPRIVLGSFERELTVRRMEWEVEELERLRRLDEERARAERERQQAVEAERQRLIETQRLRRLEPEQPRGAARPPSGSSQLPGQAPAASGAASASPPGGASSGAPAPAGTAPAASTPQTAGWAASETETGAVTRSPGAAGNADLVDPAPSIAAPPRPRAARPPPSSAPPAVNRLLDPMSH